MGVTVQLALVGFIRPTYVRLVNIQSREVSIAYHCLWRFSLASTCTKHLASFQLHLGSTGRAASEVCRVLRRCSTDYIQSSMLLIILPRGRAFLLPSFDVDMYGC